MKFYGTIGKPDGSVIHLDPGDRDVFIRWVRYHFSEGDRFVRLGCETDGDEAAAFFMVTIIGAGRRHES